MSLATKYRPKTFSEVSEQKLVVKMVESLCAQPNLTNRNFLFTGPAGCAKTTLSRIMANVLNEGKGEPIEIDAASNSGVDKMRSIVEQAQTYPIGSAYKVFIIDECFPGTAWISTPSGKIQIKDIHEGDFICNMTGSATVARVFKNHVKTDNLISVRVGDKTIITTKNHLFFTDNGWIPAIDLQKGDMLYDTTTMQTMRKAIRSEICERSKDTLQSSMSQDLDTQQTIFKTYKLISQRVSNMWKRVLDTQKCRCNNLFSCLWQSLEETESQYGPIVGATCKTLAYIYMSRMWEADGDPEQRSSNSLQFNMRCKNNESQENCCEENINQKLRMVWEFIHSRLGQSSEENMLSSMSGSSNSESKSWSNRSGIFQTNESEQSDEQSGDYTQDVSDKRGEWYITQSSCVAWWKRTLHQSANDAEEFIRRDVDIRISCTDESITKQQSESLSYELQTRPRLSRIHAGDRGGWCRPQYEIASVVRRQESELSRKLRVDSVEIYQRGNNDELFRSCFQDSELSEDYVTMYDLEIYGHPSYFVNDILVHNCHALSNAAWQSALKVLEESPAKSVFIFCTTNPEKIPATITSRVQTFQLSKISLNGIINRLKYVIDCENKEGRNITYDESALSYIAKLANGGMRDALTLLDKALAYSTHITSEGLVEALNLPQYDDYFALLAAYAKHDNENIAKLIHTIYNSGVNFVKWFEGFHSFVINVVKYIFMQDIEATMIPAHYADKISGYGPKHSVICLKLANKLLKLNAELKTTQYLQEIALTYLCTVPKKEN